MSFKFRPLLLSAILSIAGLCFPAAIRGQFIGYTSPQTVSSNPFGSTPTGCTGSLQKANVPNLGQTAHTVGYIATGSPNSIAVQILGSFDGVNFTAISDAATYAGGSIPFGQVQASGYYPVVAVGVTCTVGGSFTVSYSGTSVTPTPPNGVGQFSQIIKRLAGAASLGSNVGFNALQTPFGSSSGMLVFSPTAAPPAGSSLVVNCDNDSAGNVVQFTFPLAATTGTQAFSVPAAPCVVPILNYISGGASANTYALFYDFATPGLPPTLDPCNPSYPKNSVPINITTATTTQLVPLLLGATVSVCGVSITIAPSGTAADAATFEYGTGASCGTGTTALTGAFGAGDLTTAAPPLFVTFADPGTTFKTPAGQALCLLSAGTTVNIQGVLTYVQQ